MEPLLAAHLENTNEAIIACDDLGELVFSNKKARSLFSEPNFEISQLLKRALKDGPIQNVEIVLKQQDKDPIHLLAFANKLHDSSGKNLGASVTLQDISKSKRANEDLSNEREKLLAQLIFERNRLEAIIQQMPAGVLVAEAPDGKITLRNEQMIKMSRQLSTAEKIIDVAPIHFFDVNGKEYTQERFPAMRSIRKGEVIKEEEIEAHYPNGVKVIFSVSSVPILDSNCRIAASVVVTNDITEKKRTERNHKFLAQVKTILTSSLDFDQTIQDVANACLPILADGCILDLVEGNEVKRILTQHCDPEVKILLQELQQQFPPKKDSPQPSTRVIKSGKPEFLPLVDQEVIRNHCLNTDHANLITKIGINSHIAIPLQIRGRTIGSLNFLITSNRRPFDETDLQTAIEIGSHAAVAIDNARLYRDAQSAIQLRDNFISTASHELKTPITSVHLQIEVLSSIVKEIESKDAKYAKKVMGDAQRQIERISRLIDDMLDISRITNGKLTLFKQDTDLTKLTMEVMDRFAEQLKNHKIKYEFSSQGPVSFVGDPYRIDQVITNFITNAIRYGNRSPIKVSVSSDQDKAVLKVQDLGRGIAKDDHEKIFNRFERIEGSNEEAGLGLGLFINRQIVQEHGGSIRVESEIGKGATFIVEL